MARSIARRACSTFFSSASASGVAVFGRGTQAVVGEVAQVGLDRLQPLDEVFGVTHRGLRLRRGEGEGTGEQLGGVAHVEPRGPEVHRAAGVGGDDDQRTRRVTGGGTQSARPCGRGSRPRARVRAPSTRHRRRNRDRRRRSRATGTPARARSGPHPARCCTCRRWHGSCTTTVSSRSRSGERSLLGDPLGEVAHARRERVRRRRAEQPPVVLHRRAAPGAVDDDRRVAGHRPHDPPGQGTGLADAPGVGVQRAAAVAARTGQPDPGPGGAHDRRRRPVHVALPRVHDAPGEQVGVGGRGVGASGVRNDRADSAGSPNRRGTRWSRCATQQRPRGREQQPVPRQHDREPDPLGEPSRRAAGSAAGARRGRQRLVGALDEMTERHGRRARRFAARGTARRSPWCGGRRRRAGAPSSSTARIAAMRPRGDNCSSPVTRYVGQCGRHSPHADARDQLVLVDGEDARPAPRASAAGIVASAIADLASGAARARACRRDRRRRAPAPRASRWGRHRRTRRARERPPRAASIRRPRSVAARAASERGLVVGGHVHGADTDLGEPAHAGPVERGRRRPQRRRPDRDPTAVRALGPAAVRRRRG